ncbi:hypothetical protein DACRYDRAFT_40353, partial [Dacryopinax primogenitus]
DQNDKWQCFRLYLHLGMEPFSGSILWLKVWWTNSNPRLIFSYYLERAHFHGGIPLLTQSNPGSENNGIANGHTFLWQQLNLTLIGKLQHRWKCGHSNMKPKIKWSQLCHEFTQGYENLFDAGVHLMMGSNAFHWLAIPWIQRKVDKYVEMHNTSKPHKDKRKLLPQGIPQDIFYHPEWYDNAYSFKVVVTPEDLSLAETKYAPASHPVFELVPEHFHVEMDRLYQALGAPEVTMGNFWTIYQELLE